MSTALEVAAEFVGGVYALMVLFYWVWMTAVFIRDGLREGLTARWIAADVWWGWRTATVWPYMVWRNRRRLKKEARG